MDVKNIRISRFLEKKLIRHARRMSNEELRTAFWIARKCNEECDSKTQIDANKEKNILMEKIFAEELKRRELLEWALRMQSQ